MLVLKPGEKDPLTHHGFYDATTDADQINRWFDQWPEANIALRTGDVFDVLDVDGPNLLHATNGVPWCHSIEASTPHGWHFYYRPTGLGRKIRFTDDCDWLGAAGYVVAPPSRLADGGRYDWVHFDLDHLQEAPPELVDLVRRGRRGKHQPPWESDLVPDLAEIEDACRGWSPEGIVRVMERSVEGNRNDLLNWCAHSLGTDVSTGKVPDTSALHDALTALASAASAAGLGDAEIRRTIESGFRAGRFGRAA